MRSPEDVAADRREDAEVEDRAGVLQDPLSSIWLERAPQPYWSRR